jgi:MFS family permease
MNTWTLSYAIGKVEQGMLGIDYRDFLRLQLVAVLFFALFIPVSGALADRIGRRRFLLAVTAGIILFGLSFGWFLSPATMGSGAGANLWLMLAFLSLGMSLMGLSFGPMSALLPELFPTNTRYTGSGIAYNAASILGAALTPFVATWLAAGYGPGSVGLYLSGLGAATLVALALSEETSTKNLETMEPDVSAAAIEATSP